VRGGEILGDGRMKEKRPCRGRKGSIYSNVREDA